MSSKRDEDLVFEYLKLCLILAVLAAVAAIVLARWLCQGAVRGSVAAAGRLCGAEGVREGHVWAFAFGWLLLLAAAGLATRNVALAVAGLLLGIVVARLVFVELIGVREAAMTASRPGALVLGGVSDGWWGTPRPYVISPQERAQMMTVVGATGSGKTALAVQLIAQDLWNDASLVVIDPKDDLVARILSLLPEHRRDDLIVLDPGESAVVGFNLLARVPPKLWTLVASEVLSVFEKFFGGSWTSRQAHVTRMAVLVLLPRGDATLLDLRRLLVDEGFRRQAAFRCPNVAVRQFWLGEFEAFWKRPDVLQPLLHKLAVFDTYPEARALFGQPQPKLDIGEVVNGGKVLLISSASGVVGEELADLLCSLVVLRVQLECHRRAAMPGAQRRFVALWVDEASHIESATLVRLINESRSFNLAASLLTQDERFFSPELRIALEANVGTRLRTFQKDGQRWFEVQRLGGDEPIIFPHPGPLPALDRTRVAELRALSRARYGAATPAVMAPVAESEEAGPMAATGEVVPAQGRSRQALRVVGGLDVDED